MKKIVLILSILMLFSIGYVSAITCQQQCLNDGYQYYVCSSYNYTNSYSCHYTSPYSYCYNSYTEKFGTECSTRCFCYKINLCGKDNTECSSACSPTGCSGTTININSITNRPANTFLNDYSRWDVNYENTGGISIWAYVECHVRKPNGQNVYVSHGCSYIYSGQSRTSTEQIQVDMLGNWSLLSCSIYEAQGSTPCSSPYIYRDEYDIVPPHYWNVYQTQCPDTTFGQCQSYQNGYYQCFGNYVGKCEYYPSLNLYCWTNFRNCEAYSPPQYCSQGTCWALTGTYTTTTRTTTTTTIVGTGTTIPSTTTQTTIPIGDLGEPFETSDMPSELKFLNNFVGGILNISPYIIIGLILFVFALSIGTILIFLGRRVL